VCALVDCRRSLPLGSACLNRGGKPTEEEFRLR
jgi:hypothetical protein